MIAAGVDAAAQPPGIAVAVIDGSHPGAATVVEATVRVTDADLLAGLGGVDAAAINVPLGWPTPFVDF